ncbi:uncharacterized protein LOC131608202 [Vicia villosa]|uniref:uncharacterized protein LOC131608202 n=1 Tax=Vicia villosa TaxID=3911 RepID=UPI00273B59CE|nr:uncharacterized protein LOC131608202 [Vicia villosa]
MCSETSSPRFSFSNDVSTMKHDDNDVPRRDTSLLESNPDFEFITSKTIEFETSSADELFCNGVLLPLQITNNKKIITENYKEHPPPGTMNLPPRPFSTKIKKQVEEKYTQTSSFWGFKRSKSLDCDAKKSFTCFSPPLSRSNSTGSWSNLRRMSSNRQQSSCSAWNNLYPVQKFCSGKSYENGFRTSPVINVSTICCGLGSFFSVGKPKKNNN